MTKKVQEYAPKILDLINKSKSILLHCHPSPDPDSVGSVLATKLVLENMGKDVTVIRGDTPIPSAFSHFPGVEYIEDKSFFDIEIDKYDLFLILDSGSSSMISNKNEVLLPDSLMTVVIDHHKTNKNFAKLNLVDDSYSSTGELIYDIFCEWGVSIDHDIAINIFMGMYTDTGGFKYEITTKNTYEIATKLVTIAPDFYKYIFIMENSNTPSDLIFEGLALSSIKNFLNDNLAMSVVSLEALQKNNLDLTKFAVHSISNMLKSVVGWNIGASLIEIEPNIIRTSFRTRDSSVFDVSKLAVALGGGGHRAAAGVLLKMPIDEAVKKVVETTKIIYNL